MLGDNSTTTRLIPVQVVGPGGVGYLSDIVDIPAHCGNYHSATLQTYNTVWTFGQGNSGQLGDGTWDESHTPVSVLLPW